MRIPLEKRLRKRAHVEVAALQDEVLELLYAIDNSLVLHGGTAIWRCYGGNRFSEDLDLYSRAVEKIAGQLPEAVKKRGIEVRKMKKTANLLFCKLADQNAEIRVEVNHAARVKPVLKPYEKVDGTFMEVLTLPPEELIAEKMNAYEKRRLIRDVYDVNHLSSHAQPNPELAEKMRKFLHSLKRPLDEKNLKAIVYSGTIPSFEDIAESLAGRFA